MKHGCEVWLWSFFHSSSNPSIHPSIHPVIQGHPGPQAAYHVYEAQQQQHPSIVLQRARRIELDDESSSHGEESATPTPAKDCTTATPGSSSLWRFIYLLQSLHTSNVCLYNASTSHLWFLKRITTNFEMLWRFFCCNLNIEMFVCLFKFM